MKILVLGGRCDLVCAVDAMHHSLDHMSIAPELRKNIGYAEYDSGHMMYINLPDLKKLQADVEKFLKP